MRILIIGPAYPYRGGIAAQSERLAETFNENNYQVKIETFLLQYPNFLFPGKTQFANWDYTGKVEIKRTINSVNPFNWIKIAKRIRKEKYELVIIRYWLPFMSPCLGTISRLIKKNRHTVIISVLDNIIPHEKRIGDKFLTRWFIKPIDGFVAMSESVRNDLFTFTDKKKCKFSPHPLYDHLGYKINRENALNTLNLDPDFRYVLFFGLIRNYKGLDLLIEAFADKRITQLPVKLIVAGEFYENRDKYLEIINKNNLNEKIVIFPNFIPDNEINLYFGVSDIVAQPYKNATQSGITQIAYHFEKPMIVTNVGGLPETVPHLKAGYVVEVNPKSIADAIVDFFTTKDVNCFDMNIIEEKKKYSWSNMIKTIIELYNEIKNPVIT